MQAMSAKERVPFQKPPTQSAEQGCQTFYVVRETSAKIGLHAGNMKFNKRDECLEVHV
jgi:hypothetical protein